MSPRVQILCIESRDARWRLRPAPPVIGRALEGVRELEHAPVVTGAPDDLQADRETFRSEARGNGDGGMPGHRDTRARSHPLDVRGHWRAVDLSWIRDIGRERW